MKRETESLKEGEIEEYDWRRELWNWRSTGDLGFETRDLMVDFASERFGEAKNL